MEKFILFQGGIDQQSTIALANAIHGASTQDPRATKITILFSSQGGNIYHGFLLANIIQNSQIPIIVHAINHIDSIANIIYLSSKVRTAEPYAKFYMHGVSAQGNFDEKNLQEQLASVKINNQRIAHYVSQNTDIPFKDVTNRMLKGWTLSSQEALELKIVQKIEHKEIPKGAIFQEINFVN